MSKLISLQKTAAALTARLDKATALVIELTPKAAAAVAAANAYASVALIEGAVDAGLPNGTNVTFSYGRAETKKELSGVVVGSKPQEKGPTLYRIQSGTGFDSEIYKLFGTQILTHDYNPTPVDAQGAEDDALLDALGVTPASEPTDLDYAALNA